MIKISFGLRDSDIGAVYFLMAMIFREKMSSSVDKRIQETKKCTKTVLIMIGIISCTYFVRQG